MSITNGPNLGLMVNGLQGEAHYPELMKLWRWLDFYGQPVVKQVGLNTPPSSPADGDAYIIGTSPTGAWASLQNRITRWSGVTNTWETFFPKQGWAVKDYTTQVEYSWSGTAWAASAYVDSAVVHKAGTETMTGLKKINFNTSDLTTLSSATAQQLIGSDGAGARQELIGAGAAASVIFRQMGGTLAAPTATQSGSYLGALGCQGRGASVFTPSTVSIVGRATENFTDTANGSALEFYSTPNGYTTNRLAGSFGQDGILTANYGINLGGTANLSAYDEGTWTPTAANLGGTGIGYSTKWTKIGNRVDFTIAISGVNLATTTTTTLTLPFTPARKSATACATGNIANVGSGVVWSDGLLYTPAIASNSHIVLSGTIFLS